MISRFEDLPSDVKDAALRGLPYADDELGIPGTEEEVLSDYNSGRQARLLGATSLKSLPPFSPRASTAPDADEHRKIGPYPSYYEDQTYIR